MSGGPAAASAVPSLPDGGRFVVLDSWRGIAAVGVAIRHILGPGPVLSGPLHDNLSMAVDFFFVLSGFVIAASYGDRLTAGFSTLRFMILRYGRVWPLHICLVALFLAIEIAYAILGGGVLSGRAAFTGAREPLTIIPTMALAQAWVLPDRVGWVQQSWSISVEVGLYLTAALLWRFTGRAAWLLLLGAAFAAIAALDAGKIGVWYLVLRGFAGFGLGVAGWWLWQRGVVQAVPRWAIAVLELALVPAVLAAIAARVPYAVANPLFLLVVLVFAREAGPVSRLLRTAPFVLLGTLSYSIYMVHVFVFARIMDAMAVAQVLLGTSWVSREVGSTGVLLLSPLLSTALALAMLCAAIATAWLTWRFVEWPAREWSRRYARRVGAGREERQAPAL